MRDKKGRFLPIHNMRHTKLYYSWCGIKTRCSKNQKDCKNRRNYYEKGILVSEDWSKDFMAFYDWAITNGYKEGLTIDRIDTNGNYEPKNCRWVSHKIQNRNYSRNHFVTYNNETLCLKDMATKYGIKPSTALFRIKQGKNLDEVFKKGDLRYGKKYI